MYKLQQLFDRLVGVPQYSLPGDTLEANAFFTTSFDKERLSELAKPACWRRSARQGKALPRYPFPTRVNRQA